MAGVEVADESSATPNSMPFIVSLNAEKADSATRKLIRSHARQGRRRKRSRPGTDGEAATSKAMVRRTSPARVKFEEVIEMYHSPVLGHIALHPSYFGTTDEVKPATLYNITKVSTVAMRVIFPLVMAIGFQVESEEWLHLVRQDAAALHITAFAVEEFISRVLLRQEKNVNMAATLHLQIGLRLLRERLIGDDDESKVSDSTIGVVIKLASAAHFNGDYHTSRQHMEGLHRMVNLRGGLHVFKGKYTLVEILRYDLTIALLNGSSPLFYRLPSEPVIGYPEKLLSASDKNLVAQDHAQLIGIMDGELAAAWQVMRRFCFLVNLGTQTYRQIRPELIYDTMASVMYRLLQMSFHTNSIDEAVRHGLLAFSYHVFLQWQDIKQPYQHFSDAYRSCLCGLRHVEGVSSQLMLWLLMTGAISVLSARDEAWLRQSLREHADRCQAKTWKHMQDILKSFMWVTLLDEEPGKSIFDLLHLT